MPWIPFAAVVVLAAVYMYTKRSGQISAKEASELLKNGALVIDVRSANEFEAGHIIQARNIPLDRVEVMAWSQVKDKNTPLLLHCSTGIRSKLAMRKLESLGYKNVHNLGSYDRAGKIITGR